MTLRRTSALGWGVFPGDWLCRRLAFSTADLESRVLLLLPGAVLEFWVVLLWRLLHSVNLAAMRSVGCDSAASTAGEP